MRRLTADRAMTLGVIAFCFALALWQRPGTAVTDTKIDLHVDPGRFLGDVGSVWTPTGDLGEVHSSQYTGYLWPTGPLYALLHGIGLSPWLAQRVWLGLLLALSAWGVLKLMDVLVGRPRGVAHLVAAAFYAINPYTTVFTFRTTAILLGQVALPWLLLIVAQGVRALAAARHRWRDWAGWWWPAAFALIVTSVGGGINGAVVGWMLVGPLVLLAYEPVVGTVRWRDSGAFLVRAGVLSFLASLWWITPLLVHAKYGIDYLQFTEQPKTIWNTNAITEVLRLMAYWTSYASVGFYGAERALFSEAGTLLFNPFAVGASLLLPALAVAGYVWTRRWRYAPFLLLVLLVGVAIETAGFPSGTPVRHAMDWVYKEFFVVRFMRTTQKAAPLVAIGLAGLLGLGAQLAWARLAGLRRGGIRRAALVAAPLALAALIALAALPLVRGTAPDEQVTWKRIPSAWRHAGQGLDRDLRPNTRALVLPGQIFAFYTWGGTVDSILPRLTERPVAVRYETPYSDPHASDLLTTVDGLVQQQRLLPGQLPPLLRLMGVGSVITGGDDDITRSGAIDPAAAAGELSAQGLARPARSYGPVEHLEQARGDIGPRVAVPQVRRYDVGGGRGMVEVAPSGPLTVVDGSAQGLADMAAFGALPERTPIMYAGDLSRDQMRRYAAEGANVVITDSNRRRAFVATHTQQDQGRILGEREPLPKNSSIINPFPDLGANAQTVAVLQGARYLRAPEGGGPLPFPERQPIEAFDGDLSTLWAAARYLQPDTRWIEVGFAHPRDVPYVDLYPVHDWRGIEREVDVGGVRAPLHAGWNRIRTNLHDVSALRIRITKLDQPDSDLRGSGGFREIRIPGVHLRQPLRPPVLTAQALAGRNLSRVGLTYLFDRVTGDRPGRRDRYTGSPLLEQLSGRQDVEQRLDRVVFAPEARTYDLDAWVRPAVAARDPELDRLVGLRGMDRFDSSSRFQNQPRYRASSAFDGRPDTAWIGVFERPSAPLPWISWSSAAPRTVSRLTLTPPRPAIRRPTVVRLSWPGGRTAPLRVAPDGSVALPRPVRARSFRLTVLEARFPAGATARERMARAVGIASLTIPGLAPVAVPRAGPLRSSCGSVRVRVGGRDVRLRPAGTIEDLDAGRALTARACGGRVAMGKDVQRITALPGTFSVDLLRMRSPAPAAQPAPAGGGRVVDAGHLARSSLKGVRVALDGPSWLVLGQSFSDGWRATCNGRSLGAPVPINGYANGWRAPADCTRVAFTYAPQGTARAGYVVSALACALLLAFMAAAVIRRRFLPVRLALPRFLPDLPPERVPLVKAAAISLAATVPLMLLFALRTSVFIFPVLTFVLWRAVGPRILTAIAALLLGVVVPLLYAEVSPTNRGGYNFDYGVELINAHWVGVVAVFLLGVACFRSLQGARRARAPEGPAVAPEPERDLELTSSR